MKARRKGSNDAFREISHLSFKGDSLTYCADVFEFEQEPNQLNPEEEKLRHWETIRQQTAIAAMQGLLSNPEVTTDNIESDTHRNCLVYRAIQTADALVKKLKGE